MAFVRQDGNCLLLGLGQGERRATASLKATLGTVGPGEADAAVQLEKTPPAVGQTCRPVG